MQKVAARSRSAQPRRNRARPTITDAFKPVTDADIEKMRGKIDATERVVLPEPVSTVPQPDKTIDGQAAAVIFGHLAGDRADAEAAEIAAAGDAWPGLLSNQNAAREALLRRREAMGHRATADLELEPRLPLLAGMGEAVPARAPGEEQPISNQRAHLLNTLERPTTISVNASQRRLGLLSDAGSVALGVDTADTWQAANSIEKMLCHQLAAAHNAAMHLIGMLPPGSGRMPAVEVARLGNTAARLFETFQAGCLVLQKLKTGGTQREIVQRQQVVITKDGQTLVVGELQRPQSRRRRRGRAEKGKGRQNAQ